VENKPINFMYLLIYIVILICTLAYIIYLIPTLKDMLDLFFNGIISAVTILYVIITYKILQENQELRFQQTDIKKREIISLLYSYFNKTTPREYCSQRDNLNEDKKYIRIYLSDWNFLKERVLPNVYLFEPDICDALIKLLINRAVHKSKFFEGVQVNSFSKEYMLVENYLIKYNQ